MKASKEQAEELFAQLDGVKELEMEQESEELIKVTLTTDAEYDIREDVFFACADARLPILEMVNVTRNLEDIFLELTQETGIVGRETEQTEEREENADVSDL